MAIHNHFIKSLVQVIFFVVIMINLKYTDGKGCKKYMFILYKYHV